MLLAALKYDQLKKALDIAAGNSPVAFPTLDDRVLARAKKAMGGGKGIPVYFYEAG